MGRFAVLLAVAVGFATPVFADAIDGAWCRADGSESLSIAGPRITLPGGVTIDGEYRRHEFAYQVPPGQPNAGQVMFLQLFTEEDMASYVVDGKKLGPPTTWHRCAVQPKTS